jgi:hypothetical protein
VRMMLRAVMDNEKANQARSSGKLQKVVEETLKRLKPEAAYFGPFKGRRAAYIVFDMQDSSQLPSVAEPFFQEFGAEVEIQPVMTPDDLRKGLSALG